MSIKDTIASAGRNPQSKGQVSHLAKSSKAQLVFGNGKTLRMNTPLLFTMSPQVMTCANLSRVLRRSVG